MLAKVEYARIEKELLFEDFLSDSGKCEEIGSSEPDVILVDLPSSTDAARRILSQIQQHHPEIPLLAVGESPNPSVLIEAIRFGVKEYLSKPLNYKEFEEVFRLLRGKLWDTLPERISGIVLSFISSKGGTGSTTLVSNLAVCLSRTTGKKTLVIDLDTQLGNLADYFGIKDNRYLFQEESTPESWERDHVFRTIVTHESSGIDILSLTKSYSRKTRPCPLEFKKMLMDLRAEYDYILVDTTNALENNTVAALDLSDEIFLISKSSLPALRNTQRLLHVFHRLGYDQGKIRVLVNRYSKKDKINVPQFEKALGFEVFWTIPNDFKSLIASIQSGIPLTAINQTLPFSRALYEMSAQVVGKPIRQPSKSPGVGALSRVKEIACPTTALTTLKLSNL